MLLLRCFQPHRARQLANSLQPVARRCRPVDGRQLTPLHDKPPSWQIDKSSSALVGSHLPLGRGALHVQEVALEATQRWICINSPARVEAKD